MPRLGSAIPLVGRRAELGALVDALAAARSGQARCVLVSGDAGVGKSRLIAELTGHAERDGHTVLSGRCLELAEGGLPYLPFADVVAELARSSDPALTEAVSTRPPLGRLLPQAVPGPVAELRMPVTVEHDGAPRAAIGQDLGQLQLFEALLSALSELAEHRVLVLVVEDLHWADSGSRDLLGFLLARLRSQRLLVVVSYRGEDVHRRHPLRPWLAQVSRLPTVDRLTLAPLADRDAEDLVHALADGPVPPERVAGIVARAEGNAFFAEELLAAWIEGDEALPSVLADVLLSRIERLTPAAQRVLRAAAVADGSVGHGVLAEVVGLGESELDDALRDAVQHHVLVVEQGRYAFRHALVREALHADLLPGERTRLHAAYAARMAGSSRRGAQARLAYHSRESNDLPTALAASWAAAGESQQLGAPASALRHVEQALALWDAVPASARPAKLDELRLLLTASRLAGASGEPERAIAFARSAVGRLAAPGADIEPEDAAKTWLRLAKALLGTDAVGTREESSAAVERAWELVAQEPPSDTRAWVLATRASVQRGIRQDRAGALASAEQALADATAVGHGGAEADAMITVGQLAEERGDLEAARRWFSLAADTARAAGSVGVELRARYILGLSHDEQGEFDAALTVYRDGIRRAEEVGAIWTTFGIELTARELYLRYLRGEWDGIAEAVQTRRRAAPSVGGALLAGAAVHVVVGRGEFEQAEKIVAELAAQRRTDVLIALSAGVAAATAAYWQGRHDRAAEWVERTLEWLDELQPCLLAGIRVCALGVMVAADRAAAARDKGDAAAERAAVARGQDLLARARLHAERGRPRAGTLGPEGAAWLARAEAEATRLAGRGEVARWAQAVLAFGHGAVYDQAICRWRYAEALLGEPDSEDLVAGELREVHELAQRIGAAPLAEAVSDLARRSRVALPGVGGDRAAADPLTARERDVLEQVALGLTNRRIGEVLFISEKTVSVHLSRVMAKLGASRRAEAVAIAYDRGLLAAAERRESG